MNPRRGDEIAHGHFAGARLRRGAEESAPGGQALGGGLGERAERRRWRRLRRRRLRWRRRWVPLARLWGLLERRAVGVVADLCAARGSPPARGASKRAPVSDGPFATGVAASRAAAARRSSVPPLGSGRSPSPLCPPPSPLPPSPAPRHRPLARSLRSFPPGRAREGRLPLSAPPRAPQRPQHPGIPGARLRILRSPSLCALLRSPSLCAPLRSPSPCPPNPAKPWSSRSESGSSSSRSSARPSRCATAVGVTAASGRAATSAPRVRRLWVAARIERARARGRSQRRTP